MKSVVHFAQEVLQMQDRIDFLECEVMELREYRDKYHELLDSSTAHSAQMMGNLLALALKPGVMSALAAGKAD
jgi:hypothetical protein